MRAALREAHIDLRNPGVGLSDLADIVAWLPPGCALWRSVGGPLALSEEAHLLRDVDFRLRELAWLQSEDGRKGRNRPKPLQPVPFAHETNAEQAREDAKYAAHAARAAARSAR